MKFGNTTIGGMSFGSTRIGGAKYGNTLVFQQGGAQPYKRIPDGYTERAYMLTHSTAWIDTGVAGAEDLDISVRFQVGTYVQYAAIYANYIDENHKNCRVILNNSTSLLVAGGKSQNTTVNGFSLNRVHTIRVNSSEAYLESVRTGITASSDTDNTTNICLGSNRIDNPNTSRDINLRLYAFSIKKAGVLILNYVPCTRDSDSKPGFYDLVANSFVPSSSSVDFTAGPVAEYSGRMLKCLDWDGASAASSSKWYDSIGNQYYTISGGTHGTDYHQFINSNPASASQYATLFGALPDLGYHWEIVADIAVRTQANNPTAFVPIDYGSLGASLDGTCSTTITLGNNGSWGMNTKFNVPTSSSVYAPDDRNISDESITTSEVWIRRTVKIGVRASSESGKDETYMIVSDMGSAKSSTPYTPIRFNRWSTPMYIARSLVNPSSDYKYATTTRVYSIKVYYEPII